MRFLNDYGGSSFTGLLRSQQPDLLGRLEGGRPDVGLVHATTIAAVRYRDGVVMGGDRRATMDGHTIMNEEVTKVFKVDDSSMMAIAGAFGPSVKMVRLFQVELEHYEKIEGLPLTLEGKANKLSGMMEMNFPAAMQGLMVMPLYAGWDHDAKVGKIFEFDITGGVFSKTREEAFACSGSGGERARTTFEHFWSNDMSRDEAVGLMEKALSFAAKRDAATGGRSMVIMAVTPDGVESVRGE